jgi:ribosome biogenesis GTPase
VNEGRGTVLYGANNIFIIRPHDAAGCALPSGTELIECRIKGKILRSAEGDYNPLAAGDRVSFLPEAKDSGRAVLLSRLERKNALLRWNRKGRAVQTIAANLDLLVCVTSPLSPPFRPRFLDRLLLAAGLSGIPAMICLNKIDQGTTGGIEERLRDYGARNVPVLRCSSLTAEGLDGLKAGIRDKRVVFAGQSGVGKTSLLNRVAGGLKLKVGGLSEKYNRGRHTTVLAHMESWDGGEIIDTPGVREFEVYGISSRDLRFSFEEFEIFAGGCRLPGCTHIHEPDCAVRKAAENGEILYDRYESYCRIFDDLAGREKYARE